MANVLIVACNRIRDLSCVACFKCFRAAENKDGEFAKYDDEVKIVGMCTCGDCPGLVMPKLTLVMEQAEYQKMDIDAIHLATCIVKASQTGGCTLDLDKTAQMISGKFGKPVTLGTHNY